MKYTQKLTLTTSVSGGIGVISMRLFQSSLFDPDAAVGGHQPLWRDEWANFYEKYRVHGMKYYITLKNVGTTNPAWIAIMHYPNGYAPTASIETEWERGYCRKRVLLTALGQQGSQLNVKGYLDVAKNNGMNKMSFKNDKDYEAAMGANPVKMSSVGILTEGYSASTNLMGYINLVYYVEMLDKKDIVGS